MELQTNKLGKVGITVNKDPWVINKSYEKLDIVRVEENSTTYISRKDVPSGINFFKLLLCGPFINQFIISLYGSFINKFASAIFVSASNSPVSVFTKNKTTFVCLICSSDISSCGV